MPRTILLSALVSFLCLTASAAENWPNWRGPTYNGVAAGKGYPTKWSETENLAWKIELPGSGASTPIVWGDKIFLTCVVEGKNAVVALDRNGKTLWTKEVGAESKAKHKKATGANPSMVTDGEHVYAYFKSGDLACLDLSGKIVWQVNLQEKYGKGDLWWDLGTSPVLTKDCVVVAVMESGPSYLAAFDKKSGEERYKADRNLGAPSEAAQSYSTPVVLNQNGLEILVVLGADHVTAHDAATGKELWRISGLNPKKEMFFRSIASAVVTNDMVIAPYARARTITGIRLGGMGDVTQSHVVWTKEEFGTDVPTPAAVDGKAYVCTDKGEVACLEAASGETIWQGRVEKKNTPFSSSPLVADGKIYLTREDGTTFVIEQGKEFKLLEKNEIKGLDGEVVATPVAVDGQILLRTPRHLYCFGKK